MHVECKRLSVRSAAVRIRVTGLSEIYTDSRTQKTQTVQKRLGEVDTKVVLLEKVRLWFFDGNTIIAVVQLEHSVLILERMQATLK